MIGTHRISRAGWRMALTTGLLGLTAGLGASLGASPAAAHDQLLRAEPAADSVGPGATAIRLTFSAPPLAIGHEISVLGPRGPVPGVEQLTGNVLELSLKPPYYSGQYTVLWRVSAQDGHPISGQYSYRETSQSVAGASSPTSPTGASSTAAASAGPGTVASNPAKPPRSLRSILAIGFASSIMLLPALLIFRRLRSTAHPSEEPKI